MNGAAVLSDAFQRIQQEVHATVAGLTPDDLNARIEPGANSITWLIWHLSRLQDDHVSDAAGLEQVWTAQDWMSCLDLPVGEHDVGYGHSSRQVGKLRIASGDLLIGYHDAVHEQTLAFLKGLRDADLSRVVDEGWTPPVTLGVRLVSVVIDDSQHVGQAAFVRGILSRR